MIQHLFSYGTLQNEKVQIELFGRLLFGSRDFVKGFKLSSIDITDQSVLATSGQSQHLLAIPSSSDKDEVGGTVYKITEEELLWADKYEVSDYKRITVKLSSNIKAWIYVTNTK